MIVCDESSIFIAPDPPTKDLRRSDRIRTRKSTTPAPTDPQIPDTPHNSIDSHCTRRHKGFPCADVRSKHTADFYDSGNFGDSVCSYCSVLLLNSEVNKEHKNTFKRVTSSFCCKCGKVTLPSYNIHPQFLYTCKYL